MNLTKKEYKALETISRCEKGMPSDVNHDGITRDVLRGLERMGLVRCVALVKHNADPAYQQGREGYVLTRDGEALMEEHHDKLKKLAQNVAEREKENVRVTIHRRRDKRDEWVRGIVLLILGWILGCFAPRDLMDAIWRGVLALFH